MFNFVKKDSIAYNFDRYLKIISDENVKIYIEDRLLKQIDWYNEKSISSKRKYIGLTIVSIIMSTLIPIFTLWLGYNDGVLIKMSIVFFSSVITAISSILALSKYKELWIQYRKNCEMLKSSLYIFFTHQAQFKDLTDEEAFNELVRACEQQFLIEFGEWDREIKQQNNKKSEFIENKDVVKNNIVR